MSVEIARFWKTIKALHYDNSLSNSISSSENNHYLGCQRNLNAEIPFNRSETCSYEQSSRMIAGEIGQSIVVNNLEGLPIKKPVKRRSTSSNGSSNCMSVPLNALTCMNDIVNDEEDDDVDLFELEENEINASDDDELTIEEQEAFEAENTLIDRRLEWDTLSSDNQKTVEILLRSNYSAYLNALNDNTLEDIDIIEDSSGVEDGGSDSDDDSTVGDSLENEDYRPENESMDTFNHHDFDLDAVEKVLHIPLSRKQRLLYDDYMAGPDVRKALEGDGQTLSTVLNNLRKICNHPSLVSGFKARHEQSDPNISLTFPRIADLQYFPHAIVHAIEYDPWKNIDLSSLNMVYFDHEFTLTAITSDRIRKCCASRKMIEELCNNDGSSTSDDGAHITNNKKVTPLGPPVPSNRLKLEIQPTNSNSNSHISSIIGAGGSLSTTGGLFNQQSRSSQTQQPQQQRDQQLVQTINGQHMFYTSTIIDKLPTNANLGDVVSSEARCTDDKAHNKSQQETNHHAFHEDSLQVIARFNERRCNGMPLFGRDLVDALTVVDSIRPVRASRGSTQIHNRHRGVSYVNCLNAKSNLSSSNALRLRKRSKIAKEDPEYRYETNALKALMNTISSCAQIHSAWCDTIIKLQTPILLTSSNTNIQLNRRYSRSLLPTLKKVSSNKIAIRNQCLTITNYPRPIDTFIKNIFIFFYFYSFQET